MLLFARELGLQVIMELVDVTAEVFLIARELGFQVIRGLVVDFMDPVVNSTGLPVIAVSRLVVDDVCIPDAVELTTAEAVGLIVVGVVGVLNVVMGLEFSNTLDVVETFLTTVGKAGLLVVNRKGFLVKGVDLLVVVL